jgi:hypothetical protein
MNLLQIEIKDQYKTWGIYNIQQVNWDLRTGKIYSILIDFNKTSSDLMGMYDYNEDNNFVNTYGNLLGKILNT